MDLLNGIILRASDYLVFPSLSEGLSIVLVEAQAEKVECFVSDEISSMINLREYRFLPLDMGAKNGLKS